MPVPARALAELRRVVVEYKAAIRAGHGEPWPIRSASGSYTVTSTLRSGSCVGDDVHRSFVRMVSISLARRSLGLSDACVRAVWCSGWRLSTTSHSWPESF